MSLKMEITSWRFLGGSEWIDEQTYPPEEVRQEVESARKRLFRGYPRILPNLRDQFCAAARKFNALGKAWITVPLRQSGLQMLAVYFVYEQSRSFWNGLEIVYKPSPENQRAVSNLLAYAPGQLWAFCQGLIKERGTSANIQAMPGAYPVEGRAAFNFPLPDKNELFTGEIPEAWEDFVSPKPEASMKQTNATPTAEAVKRPCRGGNAKKIALGVGGTILLIMALRFFLQAPAREETGAENNPANSAMPCTELQQQEMLIELVITAQRGGYAFLDEEAMQHWHQVRGDHEQAEALLHDLEAKGEIIPVSNGKSYRCAVRAGKEGKLEIILHHGKQNYHCLPELFGGNHEESGNPEKSGNPEEGAAG